MPRKRGIRQKGVRSPCDDRQNPRHENSIPSRRRLLPGGGRPGVRRRAGYPPRRTRRPRLAAHAGLPHRRRPAHGLDPGRALPADPVGADGHRPLAVGGARLRGARPSPRRGHRHADAAVARLQVHAQLARPVHGRHALSWRRRAARLVSVAGRLVSPDGMVPRSGRPWHTPSRASGNIRHRRLRPLVAPHRRSRADLARHEPSHSVRIFRTEGNVHKSQVFTNRQCHK